MKNYYNVYSEMGNNIILENFEGSIVTFRGAGTIYPVHIITYCEMLHRLLNEDNWTQALRMCRRANVRLHEFIITLLIIIIIYD